MSKIHIIYPDIGTGYYPNLNHGIAFLAGAVRAAGHEFSFDHLTKQESPEVSAARAMESDSDVIGFSLCHNQRKWAKEIIDVLRAKDCKALIIAGGIYPTTDPDAALEYLGVDAIAIGEAEITLVGLLDKFKTGGGLTQRRGGRGGRHGADSIALDIHGFKSSVNSASLREIPSLSNPPPDLEKLPWPDYSVFDLQKIVHDSGGWMTMLLLRGCPYNCHYCCNSILMNLYPEKQDYFRVPSVDFAIRLIKHNLGFVKNVTGISFDDDLLCLRKDWFIEFAERYRDEICLPYTMNARVETLTDEIVDAMKKSGCRIVNIGVESGNQEVREKLLNRRYSNEQLLEAFGKLDKAGILTSTFNMIGLPGETRAQMMDTLNINKKLKPYRGACFYFYPYPRTRLYDICQENNLFTDNYDELTGYFQRPAIRMTECSERDVVRICERLRLYLYLGRGMHSLGMKKMTNVVYWLMIPFAGVVSKILVSDSKLKQLVRAFVYREARG